MIDLRYLKKLVDMLNDSTVDSIEISSDKGVKIRVAKHPQQRIQQVQIPQMQAIPAAPAVPQSATPSPAPEKPKAEPAKPAYLEVKSPMVGTYYGSPEPGAKAYLSVGDRITKGQILCIIEAMKIMNEIESEFDGVVREITARNAHPVEYGQVLFRVDPNG